MPRRTTIRDIARHLGLDQSTVSLALRHHPRISLATREKILRAADSLGYRPDPMLGALACYRRSHEAAPVTAELGWINRWSPPERFHAFREFDAYWRGASAAAREAGYQLVDFQFGDAPLSRLERMLRARGIAGIVIPPHHGARNEWDEPDLARFAVVRIGHSVRLPAHAVGCVYLSTCDQVLIENVNASNSRSGMGLKITDFYGDRTETSCIVKNNTFDANYDRGMAVYDMNPLRVEGNKCRNNLKSGINLFRTTSGGVLLNNIATGNGNVVNVSYDIWLNGCSGFSVAGNTYGTKRGF